MPLYIITFFNNNIILERVYHTDLIFTYTLLFIGKVIVYIDMCAVMQYYLYNIYDIVVAARHLLFTLSACLRGTG